MKNKQLHFFLLEFTLSLIILSVSLLVALAMFTDAAKLHRQTQALRKLSQDIVMNAETLRNPSTRWPYQNELKKVTTTYDSKGNLSQTSVAYTLTISYDTRTALKSADLVLSDPSGKVLLDIKVNALSRQVP